MPRFPCCLRRYSPKLTNAIPPTLESPQFRGHLAVPSILAAGDRPFGKVTKAEGAVNHGRRYPAASCATGPPAVPLPSADLSPQPVGEANRVRGHGVRLDIHAGHPDVDDRVASDE